MTYLICACWYNISKKMYKNELDIFWCDCYFNSCLHSCEIVVFLFFFYLLTITVSGELNLWLQSELKVWFLQKFKGRNKTYKDKGCERFAWESGSGWWLFPWSCIYEIHDICSLFEKKLKIKVKFLILKNKCLRIWSTQCINAWAGCPQISGAVIFIKNNEVIMIF